MASGMSMRMGEPGNVQENADRLKAPESYFAGVGMLMTKASMADLHMESGAAGLILSRPVR